MVQLDATTYSENAALAVIDLFPTEDECRICGSPVISHHGIPMYEDEIVPDDYSGPWAGFSVCPHCYFLVRGLQEAFPGQPLPVHVVRRLLKTHDESRTAI
jgi:hypothetical protein